MLVQNRFSSNCLFWICLVVFFWYLVLEVGMFSVLFSFQRKHNRLFACFGSCFFVHLLVLVFFDFCWFVFPYKTTAPKTPELEKITEIQHKSRARRNPEPRSEVWWWNLRWSFGGKCFWRFSPAKEARKSPSKLRRKFATNFAENFANFTLEIAGAYKSRKSSFQFAQLCSQIVFRQILGGMPEKTLFAEAAIIVSGKQTEKLTKNGQIHKVNIWFTYILLSGPSICYYLIQVCCANWARYQRINWSF